MEVRAGALIDSAARKLLSQSRETPNKAGVAFLDQILKEPDLVKKIATLLKFVFLTSKASNPDFHHFYRVVIAEETSAPKDVKSCIEWYPQFSAERKAIQKTHDESIKSFSIRLCAIQQTLKELGDRLQCDRRKPANGEIEALTREVQALKIANQKYEAQIQCHETAVAAIKETEEKLKFDVETQKEKSRIMRNDLNFVLRQKQEVENQLCIQQDLVRQKNAECLSFWALLKDRTTSVNL
jgi:septal ring factor EnvC (AmiA/AmiB activator)